MPNRVPSPAQPASTILPQEEKRRWPERPNQEPCRLHRWGGERTRFSLDILLLHRFDSCLPLPLIALAIAAAAVLGWLRAVAVNEYTGIPYTKAIRMYRIPILVTSKALPCARIEGKLESHAQLPCSRFVFHQLRRACCVGPPTVFNTARTHGTLTIRFLCPSSRGPRGQQQQRRQLWTNKCLLPTRQRRRSRGEPKT